MTESSDRFPFPRPYGWFPVGRLDELPDEPVSSLRAQGTDLVLWRDDTAGDDESAWRVFDAYCPHLGAHLGVGGRVVRVAVAGVDGGRAAGLGSRPRLRSAGGHLRPGPVRVPRGDHPVGRDEW